MKIPVKFDEILLPKETVDMKKWCVVACDQFTSQTEYWQQLAAYVGKDHSTLNLIFPECYLNDKPEMRIKDIIKNMEKYLDDGIFRAVPNGMVLLERDTSYGHKRTGLTMLVDLTAYSFRPEDKAMIRATEGTVIERIPPRVKIRENCPLELPHIMLLIDDEKRTVIEPLFEKAKKLLYDVELNMDGGRLKGYSVEDTEAVEKALEVLLSESVKKYGESFLFAVGDGNHSLATAKACYKENNPLSKYALVEVANIYDDGIIFEPIHRLIEGVDVADFTRELAKAVKGGDKAKMFIGGKEQTFDIPCDEIEGVAAVQEFLDKYLKEKGGEIDYIHGEDDLRNVCRKTGGIGLMLKPMDKGTLFSYIIKNGALPRKTFSMGEASEKRYYVEARKIK